MENSQNKSLDNDTLFFAEESKNSSTPKNKEDFKLLIVDDENEIHVMTKLVLSDYSYKGSGLKFLSAFSAKEAKVVIKENQDIACCLLDVVMETTDAGLEVAKFIREEEKNKKLRIILRTGQPGKAPEKDIIVNYDINDYKEKTELTDQKLFTTITTALRSYIHLVELDKKNIEIQSKNLLLNEEIARRIVAESNLTKYNRSLEKMIESKSNRLKEAILTLETTKEELQKTIKATVASDISSLSIDTFENSSTMVKSNLKKIDQYGNTMTILLEKYNVLEKIIKSRRATAQSHEKVTKTIQSIEDYKTQINFDNILKKYPEIIRESAQGIEQISNALSDIKLFVSICEEPCQPTDIIPILEKKAAAGSKEFKGKIDVQLDLEQVPLLSLPPVHFGKAVNAILENAFQAISSKGIISVSCKHMDTDIIVCISDIGCGISKKDLPHIFSPYFTGNKKSGKGLGLAFAKSVILNCNGKIEIASSSNEGTTVTIILPA